MSEIAATNDMVFRLGGEGGEGVLSTGQLLTQALARAGFKIYSLQSYPAEIRGGHAQFQVRVSDKHLLSQGDFPNVLLAFNEEAYDKQHQDMSTDSVLVYDSDSFTPPTDGKATAYYGIPFTSIAIEDIGLKLVKNMVALGSLAGLFNIPKEPLEQLVREKFNRKGEAIVEKNIRAIHAGYTYAKTQVSKTDMYRLEPSDANGEHLVMSGNDALTLGALCAGVKFYAGYPITPATDIMESLAAQLPKDGGVVLQTEDEMAAIGAVIGASYAGKKAMTATSGPGLSLMVEFLGLATMAEIPIVVVDVQRVGPSTGMPTKTEQGDLYLAVYGGHGSCPRVVMALSSVRDSFYDMIHAFNIAEEYQMPVLVLSDQYLGHRKATVPRPDLSRVRVKNRTQPTRDELQDYKRYSLNGKSGVSPMSIPGTAGGGYVATGLEHSEYGVPAASDYKNHYTMTSKRYQKFAAVETIANELVHVWGEEHPEIGIIGWGSTEGVIREAIEMAQAKGISVGAMHPKILYPLPIDRLRPFIQSCKKIIIPENNFTGQFSTLLHKRFTKDFLQLNKSIGLPLSPVEIYEKIQEVASTL